MVTVVDLRTEKLLYVDCATSWRKERTCVYIPSLKPSFCGYISNNPKELVAFWFFFCAPYLNPAALPFANQNVNVQSTARELLVVVIEIAERGTYGDGFSVRLKIDAHHHEVG